MPISNDIDVLIPKAIAGGMSFDDASNTVILELESRVPICMQVFYAAYQRV